MTQYLITFLFYNHAETTNIYSLSLHDALPISRCCLRYRSTVTSRSTRSSRRAVSRRARQSARYGTTRGRSEEHTSELQSHSDLVCRLLLEKKKIEQSSLLRRHDVR